MVRHRPLEAVYEGPNPSSPAKEKEPTKVGSFSLFGSGEVRAWGLTILTTCRLLSDKVIL